MKMFASFRIGEFELAMDVLNLQEVINLPEERQSLTSVPAYMMGAMTLRKAMIPLLDMATFLGVEANADITNKKVAIMSLGRKTIGIVFDNTAEIVHLQDSDISFVTHRSEGPRSIINGAIKVGDEQRLVELIDLARVLDNPELEAAFAQCVYVEKEEKNQKAPSYSVHYFAF